jgi:predicted CoA-binding protein
MNPKKTLILGASENPKRYSFLAINMLREFGHPVVAIGNKTGKVGDVPFSRERPVLEFIDTVTLYLNPKNQEEYYDYILSLQPQRIIFNPGTENEELEKMAVEKGIQVQEACTLVLLRTGQY